MRNNSILAGLERTLKTTQMKIIILATGLLFSFFSLTFAQTPAPASVENEKFVFLNNGVTIGMIVKSVLKADKQRLKLTDAQLPKAKEVITNATVKYNDGVKKLKASGMSQQKLRVLAIAIETEKVHNYKPILTPEQYAILVANHKKMYPESKV
ncbi:hypothetical protein SAMN05216167_108186 [Spirosoma endophyticum]|uniref:Uncharacterized protein n=2 Tax=Spirosoma endophyticum TaxID=662367 RepID=A0A1I1WF48_9BACT|nr:hypothetical protein SAMN05216167_108186 [Spirosoma endophyticum]